MFKKLASDLTGFSDIGEVIDPSDFDKADADDYVLHEDNEKIYFLIKSKSDEYCFTNLSMIHLDGTSAISSKRVLYRYPYAHYPIKHVMFETAGTVDLDVEVKFSIGDKAYSIDINKKQIEHVKDLYKALLAIEEIQREGRRMMEYANTSLTHSVSILSGLREGDMNVPNTFKELNEHSFDWLQRHYHEWNRKDFGTVYEKYINN
ncbi:PH domain-containing protein [Exiguobacterium aestuarii]|uniref:PH domain-containing protein n=1 Tax=Exiguobacterium aestuarii TaxID=273527 RepID=A0ABW2PMZ9_9BACL|nr:MULTISPECIES: PH domain-containing protein [Exiguobacterium]MCT4787001.1 PH domain-containing protein [Exiguobacterium aestuarii]